MIWSVFTLDKERVWEHAVAVWKRVRKSGHESAGHSIKHDACRGSGLGSELVLAGGQPHRWIFGARGTFGAMTQTSIPGVGKNKPRRPDTSVF